MKTKTRMRIPILLCLAITLAACAPATDPGSAAAQRNLSGIQAQHTLDAVTAGALAATEEADLQATDRAWELWQATLRAGDAQATATAQAGVPLAAATPLEREVFLVAFLELFGSVGRFCVLKWCEGKSKK